ncbi:sulfatase [Planctomycetota bacterium]|nr:sulfatase [Planctomycetota bacterium]
MISKRSGLLAMSAVVGGSLLLGQGEVMGAEGSGGEVVRPNVLMLAVDDWNDWLPALGDNRAITPNLDRLAARGVTMANGHSPAVYSAPSRTALMTGMNATTTGIYHDQIFYVADPSIEDLPRYFKKHGYKTVGAGKIYHHMPGCIDMRSWDEYFVWNPVNKKNGWSYEAWAPKTGLLPKELPVSEVGKNILSKGVSKVMPTHWMDFGVMPNDLEPKMADTITTDFGAKFLKEKHVDPFFLAVGIYAPHKPNYVPEKYFDLYPLNKIEVPEFGPSDPTGNQWTEKLHKVITETPDGAKKEIQAYLAAISYADAQLGKVLDSLEASEYFENTIVVLWSDHGYHHGEHHRWMKHTQWQRTSHVPFIWAGPGIAKGEKVEGTRSLLDIYPTLVSMAGLSENSRLEGVDMKNDLANPKGAEDREVLVPLADDHMAVVNQKWRYVVRGKGEFLYDLTNDPQEFVNLAKDMKYAKVKAELKSKLPANVTKESDEHRPMSMILKKHKDETYEWRPKPNQK